MTSKQEVERVQLQIGTRSTSKLNVFNFVSEALLEPPTPAVEYKGQIGQHAKQCPIGLGPTRQSSINNQ